MDIHDATVIYGPSCKPMTLLTCGDVHPGGMPDHTSCICGVNFCTSETMERAIGESKAPAPTEPEELDPPRIGWWTVYALPPPDGMAGGVGKPDPEVPMTRKQRRASLKAG